MRFALAFFAVTVTVTLGGCSNSTPSPPGPKANALDTSGPSAKMIGPSGGIAVSNDGLVTVTVPTGALAHDTAITITPAAAPIPGALGQTYEIGPTGTQFAMPVTLAFVYDPAKIDGNWPADLLIGTVVSGAWVATSTATIDEGTSSVIGRTSHFSPFALIVHPRDWDAAADQDAQHDAAQDAQPTTESASK